MPPTIHMKFELLPTDIQGFIYEKTYDNLYKIIIKHIMFYLNDSIQEFIDDILDGLMCNDIEDIECYIEHHYINNKIEIINDSLKYFKSKKYTKIFKKIIYYVNSLEILNGNKKSNKKKIMYILSKKLLNDYNNILLKFYNYLVKRINY